MASLLQEIAALPDAGAPEADATADADAAADAAAVAAADGELLDVPYPPAAAKPEDGAAEPEDGALEPAVPVWLPQHRTNGAKGLKFLGDTLVAEQVRRAPGC